MSVLSTTVGPVQTLDGVVGAPLRQDRTRSIVLKMATGKYAEAVLRGNCYWAHIPPGTGQAPGTVLGTTAFLSLGNPANSQKRLRILGMGFGYISGTLGSGEMVVAVNTTAGQAMPTGGTAITPVNALIMTANASVAKVGFGTTLPNTPLSIDVLFSAFAELATTANGFQPLWFDINCRYMLDQGGILSAQFVGGAGTSPLMTGSIFWEDVPLGQE